MNDEELQKFSELVASLQSGYGYIILEPNKKDKQAFSVRMIEKFKDDTPHLIINKLLRGMLWIIENDLDYIVESGEENLNEEISEIRKKEFEGTNVLDFFQPEGKKKN